MLHLLVQHTVLADGISIRIGENVWSFSTNFIVYLIIAALVGFAAEFIVGWRLPFGKGAVYPFKIYPTPRMVWIKRGALGESSIFSLKYRM